ncbi:MAG TPA: glycosyltransferase family 4 protein [Actinotalea sp.]
MTRAPLRVVFLDHTVEAGGAELALVRTLAHVPGDVRVRVAVPRGAPGVFSGVGALRVPVGAGQRPGATSALGLRAVRVAIATVVQAARIRRHPVVKGCDLVVANTSRSALSGGLATVMTRRRLVIHLRDEVTAAALGRRGLPPMRWALRRADLVIANSRHTLGTASAYLRPGTPVAVIPSPPGVAALDSPPPISSQLARVGMVARIDPWKGHELLLRAFAQTFRGEAVELHLAGAPAFGKDAHLAHLEQLADDLGIAAQVRFEGHIEDVAAFVDRMDVCVQCSLRPEPLGQNVLQYLARRTPAVVTSDGGPSEWVQHLQNGLLFERGSVDSLAAALRRLADDGDLRQRLAATSVAVPDDRTVSEALFRTLNQAGSRRQHPGIRGVERAVAGRITA